MFDFYRLKQSVHYKEFIPRVPATSTLIIISTLLGSWLGAFVVALDWEEPWQVIEYSATM